MSHTLVSTRLFHGPRYWAMLNGAYSDGTIPLVPDALDACLDASEQRFRTHRRSTVARTWLGDHHVVIKRFNLPDTLTRLKRMVSRTPARQSWINAQRLLAMDIATPTPISCVERRYGPLRGESYLITAHVVGYGLDQFFSDPAIDDARKTRVGEKVLEIVARLHRSGYIHGDLKARNILVRNDQPLMIDLDTVEYRWFPGRLRRGITDDIDRLMSTAMSGDRSFL
ncbi:MAG: lipopolysaccharide kinase InaA family protein [Aquisalimonadaceae bacterium]